MTGPEPHPYRSFEHAGWQSAAPRYAGTFAHATGAYVDALLDAAQVGAGSRTADIACGHGHVAAAAAARGARASGYDFSDHMLAEARQRHPGIDFHAGDAEALPLPDGALDAVVNNFGLHHLAFPARGAAEARRILAAGGRFAATVWAAPTENIAWQFVFDAIARHGDAGIDLPTSPHGRLNSADALTDLLRSAGFPASAIEVRTVTATWTVARPDDLIDGLLAGTVRMAAMMRAQAPAAFAAIRGSVADAVSRFAVAGAYVVPTAALLVSATREPPRGR